jgi:hypothetical protein
MRLYAGRFLFVRDGPGERALELTVAQPCGWRDAWAVLRGRYRLSPTIRQLGPFDSEFAFAVRDMARDFDRQVLGLPADPPASEK